MKSTILKDIINSFVSIAKGLWVTLTHWGPARGSVTELYPEQKPQLPENFRGMPTLPVNPKTGRPNCIACGACARMCPEQIIIVEAEKGTDPKDRRPAKFEIDISRCMWCGLCMEVCPTGGLTPARTFEHACYTRKCMVLTLEDLMKLGGELPAEPENEEEKEPEKPAPAEDKQS